MYAIRNFILFFNIYYINYSWLTDTKVGKKEMRENVDINASSCSLALLVHKNCILARSISWILYLLPSTDDRAEEGIELFIFSLS